MVKACKIEYVLMLKRNVTISSKVKLLRKVFTGKGNNIISFDKEFTIVFLFGNKF